MDLLHTEPIEPNWISEDPEQVPATHASARDVNQMLGQLDIGDIDDRLVPFLAAAAAELAFGAEIGWRFSADDAPVALLRLIAKVGVKDPHVGGPHTDRLLSQLR